MLLFRLYLIYFQLKDDIHTDEKDTLQCVFADCKETSRPADASITIVNDDNRCVISQEIVKMLIIQNKLLIRLTRTLQPKQSEERDELNEWHHIVVILDRFCFIVYCLVTITVFVWFTVLANSR